MPPAEVRQSGAFALAPGVYLYITVLQMSIVPRPSSIMRRWQSYCVAAGTPLGYRPAGNLLRGFPASTC